MVINLQSSVCPGITPPCVRDLGASYPSVWDPVPSLRLTYLDKNQTTGRICCSTRPVHDRSLAESRMRRRAGLSGPRMGTWMSQLLRAG